MHILVERCIRVPTFFPHWIRQSGKKNWTWKLQKWKTHVRSHTRINTKPSWRLSISIDSFKILSHSRAHENIGWSRSLYKQVRVQRCDSERLDVVLTVSDDRRSLSWSRAPLAPRSGCIWVRVRLYISTYQHMYIHIHIYENARVSMKYSKGKKVGNTYVDVQVCMHTVKETNWTLVSQAATTVTIRTRLHAT